MGAESNDSTLVASTRIGDLKSWLSHKDAKAIEGSAQV